MPGYCHRHRREVPHTLWVRCRTNPEFCRILDKAHGVHAGHDSAPNRMPALWKRAITFVLAMAYWWWYDGCRTARPVVIGNRNLICKPCQHNVNGWCSACGCKISLKTMIPSQHCPKRNWHAVNPPVLLCGRVTFESKKERKRSFFSIGLDGILRRDVKCGCGNAKQPA